MAAFVPEQKGGPATARKGRQFPFPDDSDGQTCAKSFYRAQDCKLAWSPHGHGVLVQTHTDVDATGGELLRRHGFVSDAVDAEEEGRAMLLNVLVHHYPPSKRASRPGRCGGLQGRWEPTDKEGKDVRQLLPVPYHRRLALRLLQLGGGADLHTHTTFGNAHRNVICWAPHGRFLALCGFGNLAGDVDFWDRKQKKKIGSVNMPCAVEYGWSPDSLDCLSRRAHTPPRLG